MNPERRGFAKGLGLAGFVAVGVAGYKEVKERIVYKQDEVPSAELEKQIEGKPVLALMATYGEEIKKDYQQGQYIFYNAPTYKEGTEKHVEVRIVPGPDGKLYVKENDSWRKI
jgi:hypothetical protein